MLDSTTTWDFGYWDRFLLCSRHIPKSSRWPIACRRSQILVQRVFTFFAATKSVEIWGIAHVEFAWNVGEIKLLVEKERSYLKICHGWYSQPVHFTMFRKRTNVLNDICWGLPKPCHSGKIIITGLRRDLNYPLLSTATLFGPDLIVIHHRILQSQDKSPDNPQGRSKWSSGGFNQLK